MAFWSYKRVTTKVTSVPKQSSCEVYFKLPPMYSVNYSVLSSLNLLNVEDRVKQLRLNHVFNIHFVFHAKAPSYLCDKFVLRSIVSVHRTRSCSNFDFNIPKIKSCESGSFFYNGVKNWNELPRNIKVCKTKDVFKSLVKQHVLNQGLSK